MNCSRTIRTTQHQKHLALSDGAEIDQHRARHDEALQGQERVPHPKGVELIRLPELAKLGESPVDQML